ncbi:hypothetical protein Q5752_006788 [Cryptotrichosporon argae]
MDVDRRDVDAGMPGTYPATEDAQRPEMVPIDDEVPGPLTESPTPPRPPGAVERHTYDSFPYEYREHPFEAHVRRAGHLPGHGHPAPELVVHADAYPPYAYAYAPPPPAPPAQAPATAPADLMSTLMMNQMMVSQMNAQQMQAAQMVALTSNMAGGGPRRRPLTPVLSPREIRQVITGPQVPGPAVITSPASMDNWQEATLLLCLAVIALIYLVTSRTAGGDDKKGGGDEKPRSGGSGSSSRSGTSSRSGSSSSSSKDGSRSKTEPSGSSKAESGSSKDKVPSSKK